MLVRWPDELLSNLPIHCQFVLNQVFVVISFLLHGQIVIIKVDVIQIHGF